MLACDWRGRYVSSASRGEIRVQYISTRGKASKLDFDEVLLAGLASDGGLYLPESWPQFDAASIREMQNIDYAELAVRVMTPFLGGELHQMHLRTSLRKRSKGLRIRRLRR